MKVVAVQPIANVEVTEFHDGVLHLGGWIVDRTHPLTHVTLRLGARPWAERLPLFDRPDVLAALYPEIAHTVRCGFDVASPVTGLSADPGSRKLEIIAEQDGEARGAVVLGLRDLAAELERFPVPPEVLKRHVGGERDDFLSTGWRIYSDLRRALDPYGGWAAFGRILDWGCGCGRVMRYLLEEVAPERVAGCDIDRGAVDWLGPATRGASIQAIAPDPPTRYPDSSFDLVYGVSIFTHLGERMQHRWLAELRRITSRNGLVAVTVHGPELAPAGLRRRLERRGFADPFSEQASFFAPYAGRGYYRTAFHTPTYVEREWSRYLEVLEYRCRGINAHQDLVIMRKL